MSVIFTASTGLGAPRYSSRLLRPVIYWLFPQMPEATFQKIHYAARKGAHLAEYAVLGALMLRAVAAEPALPRPVQLGPCAFAILLCAAYAATDEFHQRFVPERHPAVADVMLDTCGAAIGAVLARAAQNRRRP